MDPRLSLQARITRDLRLGALSWFVLATGLGLTGMWSHQQRSYEKLEHERIERDLAESISQAMISRLKINIGVLDGVIGLFDASTAVTREEFHEFYMALNRRGDTLRGIQGVGYAAVVPNNNVPVFELNLKQGIW